MSSTCEFYRRPDTAERPRVRRLISNALHLVTMRVRAHPAQELFALAGIAVGVALLFGVQVASTSITGSVRHLAIAITGDAKLEIAARSPDGFDQRLLAKVEAIPAVLHAAPIVMQPVTVRGPKGNRSLTLAGLDRRIEGSGGELVRKFAARRQDPDAIGFVLTSDTARAIGARTGEDVTIDSGAVRRETLLGGVLGPDDVGDLDKSPIALAPLGTAQRLTQLNGRINRILVTAKRGREAEAIRDLQKVAGGRSDVRSSTEEVELLDAALTPDRQSSLVFSAIAVAVAMLFAFNAILLSLAQRRRFNRDLRLIGSDRSTIVMTLAFEAVLLGVVASAAGILLGDAMSRFVFNSFPRYLSSGFPIGEQRVIEPMTIMLSVAGGLVAATAALAIPAVDLFFEPGSGTRREMSKSPRLTQFAVLACGVIVTALSALIAYAAPTLVPVCLIGFVVGMVLVGVPVISGAIGLAQKSVRTRGGIAASTALNEMADSRTRTVVLALIAAVAAFATVSVGGARHDVERGTETLNQRIFQGADLWVIRGGVENSFLTNRFEADPTERIVKSTSSVESVGRLHGVFADIDGKRVLVAAHPVGGVTRIASNVVLGDPRVAEARIASGGWIGLYDVIAREKGVGIGDWFSVPTPSGKRRFRVAALVSNYGWPSGVIVMNNREFSSLWRDGRVSALAIDLKPGVSVARGRSELVSALGPSSALSVQTPNEAAGERMSVVAQGMSRLKQISALIMIAAALALVFAMFAAVWQRRNELASLRAIGLYRLELFRSLLIESAFTVMLGALMGSICGFGAQFFASRWIARTSGFHAPYRPAVELGFTNWLSLAVLTVVVTAIPAFFVARIRPQFDRTY